MRSARGILEVRSANSRPSLPGPSPDISRPFHLRSVSEFPIRGNTGFTEIHVAMDF